MIAEILFSILFFVVFWRQLVHLSPMLRYILWFALFVHICIIGGAHYWAVQQDTTGIVFDTSVDAQKYYFSAKVLSTESLFSITPADITKVSGGVWHHGYYYLNIVCMKISADPMLLMRMIKMFVFFFALAFAARYWQQRYGIRAAMWGLLYLSLGWWEIIYHNFRNYRDGLITSLCLLTYILCDRMIFSAPLRQRSGARGRRISFFRYPISCVRKMGAWVRLVVVRYGLLIICLALLASLRIYLAVIIVAGIAVQIVMKSRISVWRQVTLVLSLALLGMAPIVLKHSQILSYGTQLFAESMDARSYMGIGIGCLKTLVAPIPWQHSHEFLIPSQCMYLMMLGFSLLAIAFMIRPKPWGQVFIVVLLTLFLGIIMESSYARKRLVVVPIFVSWMVAGISRIRKRRLCRDPLSARNTIGASTVLHSNAIKENPPSNPSDSNSRSFTETP